MVVSGAAVIVNGPWYARVGYNVYRRLITLSGESPWVTSELKHQEFVTAQREGCVWTGQS